MGMFSTRTGFYSEGAAIDFSDIVAQECFEDNMHTAALRVVAESENNWNQIMQAMAITELASYEETGDADYYITEAGTGFLQSVKDFFKKLLEKIKGIFTKFIRIVDSWSKSDKDFVRKYKSDILKAYDKDFEYEGYKFTINNVPDPNRAQASANSLAKGSKDLLKSKGFEEKSKSDIEDATKELRGDKLEDKLDQYRAEALKVAAPYSGSKIDSADFSSELFEALRNGESSKVTLEGSDIDKTKFLQEITNTEDMKKSGRKYFDALNKGINDAIKQCDTWEKEIRSDIPKADKDGTMGAYISYLGAFTGYLRHVETINTTVYGAWLQAVKDRNRQAKAICVKLMSYKVKNESTSYYEEGGSILGNIHMI